MTMNDMNEKIMNLTDEQMEQVAGGESLRNMAAYSETYREKINKVLAVLNSQIIELKTRGTGYNRAIMQLLKAYDALSNFFIDESYHATRDAAVMIDHLDGDDAYNRRKYDELIKLSEEILKLKSFW